MCGGGHMLSEMNLSRCRPTSAILDPVTVRNRRFSQLIQSPNTRSPRKDAIFDRVSQMQKCGNVKNFQQVYDQLCSHCAADS